MLNLLAEAWHGGLTEFSVFVLRMLFVPLLIYNLTWSTKTCLSFLRSHMMTIALPSLMIMFMSAGTLIRQIQFFSGYPNEYVGPIALTSLCLLILASCIAAIGHNYNLATKFSSFYWLVQDRYFPLALRTAELARLDRDYVEAVLDNAETTVAVRLAQKVLGSK